MRIHGHTILTKLKIPSHAWDEQVAWVQGYILALEDVIKDVAEYRARVIMGRELDDPYQVAFGIQDMVTKTLTQARATLAALERLEQDESWKHFSGGLEPEETEDALQPTQARQDQAEAPRPGPGSAQQGPGRLAQAGPAGSSEEPGGQGKTETE